MFNTNLIYFVYDISAPGHGVHTRAGVAGKVRPVLLGVAAMGGAYTVYKGGVTVPTLEEVFPSKVVHAAAAPTAQPSVSIHVAHSIINIAKYNINDCSNYTLKGNIIFEHKFKPISILHSEVLSFIYLATVRILIMRSCILSSTGIFSR